MSPVPIEYMGTGTGLYCATPFRCKSGGGGNLSSQSLQTRPQAHGNVARQCIYYVTVRRVRVTIVAVEKH